MQSCKVLHERTARLRSQGSGSSTKIAVWF